SMDEAATSTLAAMKEAGERMPGFGHRYHTKDPRTARLFELAHEAGVDGVYMKAARVVEKSFADAKKSLPINVDGAIGAILAELFNQLNKSLKSKFSGNISWYGETVKLDLEARKTIERTYSKPQKYRLKPR